MQSNDLAWKRERKRANPAANMFAMLAPVREPFHLFIGGME